MNKQEEFEESIELVGDLESIADEHNFEEEVKMREIVRIYLLRLEAKKPRWAQAVYGRYFGNKTYKAIGKDLGVGPEAARQLLDRGMNQIRRDLGKNRGPEYFDSYF